MAIGVYRRPTLRPPHPSIPAHLFVIAEQALAEAWKQLKRRPPAGFDILTATEDVVTFHLHRVLVNEIYRKRRVAGFVRETFNPPQREPKVCTYNRSSLDKMPDLRIDLVDRPNVSLLTDDGIFIECKPIDGAHSVPAHYCRRGALRFVAGEYGWAMREGIMVAYVAATHRGGKANPLQSLHDVLVTNQKADPDPLATIQLPVRCPVAVLAKVATAAWTTRHRRSFTYVETGKTAPEVSLRHLWLYR